MKLSEKNIIINLLSRDLLEETLSILKRFDIDFFVLKSAEYTRIQEEVRHGIITRKMAHTERAKLIKDILAQIGDMELEVEESTIISDAQFVETLTFRNSTLLKEILEKMINFPFIKKVEERLSISNYFWEKAELTKPPIQQSYVWFYFQKLEFQLLEIEIKLKKESRFNSNSSSYFKKLYLIIEILNGLCNVKVENQILPQVEILENRISIAKEKLVLASTSIIRTQKLDLISSISILIKILNQYSLEADGCLN